MYDAKNPHTFITSKQQRNGAGSTSEDECYQVRNSSNVHNSYALYKLPDSFWQSVEFVNFEHLFYIQPLIYLFHIISHFLFTALLHNTGLP